MHIEGMGGRYAERAWGEHCEPLTAPFTGCLHTCIYSMRFILYSGKFLRGSSFTDRGSFNILQFNFRRRAQSCHYVDVLTP